MAGAEDTHCSADHAERIKSEIGPAVVTLDKVPDFNHGTFGSATDKAYVDLVDKNLAMDDHMSIQNILF